MHPAFRPSLLLGCPAEIPDARIERAQRPALVDILAITILATLRGADPCVHLAECGRVREV
jgi:hypothetical protein